MKCRKPTSRGAASAHTRNYHHISVVEASKGVYCTAEHTHFPLLLLLLLLLLQFYMWGSASGTD
jgi:hypothetical protein